MTPHGFSPCVRRLVDSHFAGRIGPSDERRLRSHLPACEACQRYYDRHLLLEKIDPTGLGARTRLARGLGLQPQRRPVVAWSLALACCAAFAVIGLVPRAATAPHEFTARGGAPAERAELFAYRASPSEPLGPRSTIRPTDDLAFAYTNAAGFERLLVFGVDEHRHVYWYYPAWTRPTDEPRAIRIERGAELRELPEAIRHDLDGLRLTIHAVFLNEDLSVQSIERLVAGWRGPEEPAALEGSYEQQLTLEVVR